MAYERDLVEREPHDRRKIPVLYSLQESMWVESGPAWRIVCGSYSREVPKSPCTGRQQRVAKVAEKRQVWCLFTIETADRAALEESVGQSRAHTIRY